MPAVRRDRYTECFVEVHILQSVTCIDECISYDMNKSGTAEFSLLFRLFYRREGGFFMQERRMRDEQNLCI